jgi:chemotaxis protein methyltransferase CheR
MEIDNQQLSVFLEAIFNHYGYDFRNYSKASLKRRLNRIFINTQVNNTGDLLEQLMKSPASFEYFLQELTVNVTEMFRDPAFFLSLRKKVLPALSTYPFIKIWDAGCSSGEELFSLAIMLKEEKLLHRSKIYATDINQRVLKEAKEGIFPLNTMKIYSKNYQEAGGKLSLADYYHANYERAIFNSDLLENVVFYPHNLATDKSFNEFHLIICRNVLIYFDKELQDKVVRLFYDSLATLGYIGLGQKETLFLSPLAKKFDVIDKEEKIYRKIDF